MTVKRGFKPPVHAEEFQLFAFLCKGAVEEIEVEHRPDDVAFDTGAIQRCLVDDALSEQGS